VGFGAERDLRNLRALRDVAGKLPLMVDANQAWDLPNALDMAGRLQEFDLRWLEEPLRADRPWPEWQQLAAAAKLPLAGGENIAGTEAFDTALAAGALAVVQPDMAKWGGFSGCLPVARAILASGKRYCPHFLGGGVGLLASAHLLAAVGGDGLLEIDANPNPLRTLTCGAISRIHDGRAKLDEAPGLGLTLDPAVLREYAVRL
jgi:D-galactarolactone cycloisomerase